MPGIDFPAGPAKLTGRTFWESLLAVTLIAVTYYFLAYIPHHIKAGEPVLGLSGYFLTYAPVEPLNVAAYVLPDSATVWDTPAEIRNRVATLQSGEEVKALARFRTWTHVRTTDGRDGWISNHDLLSAEAHDAEGRLRTELGGTPVQAVGHTSDKDNIHVEPRRQSAVVAVVEANQPLQIYRRRLVRRPADDSSAAALAASPVEAWYLVTLGNHTGWILGRRVQLDVPKSLAAYAQETNLVAWLTINTVNDNGRAVPQYLVADRIGNQTCDFTGVRVLTWWKKRQIYAIAYQENELQGYFPLTVARQGSVPSFRLLLIDDAGNKYQKVYGLFDTLTHVLGSADTWQNDAALMNAWPRREAHQR